MLAGGRLPVNIFTNSLTDNKHEEGRKKTKKGKKLKHDAYVGSLKIGKKGDGKDVSHTSKGLRLASPKANRSKKGIHA